MRRPVTVGVFSLLALRLDYFCDWLTAADPASECNSFNHDKHPRFGFA